MQSTTKQVDLGEKICSLAPSDGQVGAWQEKDTNEVH